MGKFVIKPTANDKVMFNLHATNGQVICTSQAYASMKTCEAGIESVKKNCAVPVEDQTVNGYEALKHPKYEVYMDAGEKFRFRLKASNGEIIAASQGYTDKRNCLNGIESIRKNAPDAEVIVEESEE